MANKFTTDAKMLTSSQLLQKGLQIYNYSKNANNFTVTYCTNAN